MVTTRYQCRHLTARERAAEWGLLEASEGAEEHHDMEPNAPWAGWFWLACLMAVLAALLAAL